MLKFVILGLGVGSLYAISALGIVCIHRGSKVLNLAHGGIATWGAYLFVRLRDAQRLSGAVAVLVVLAAAGLFGVAAFLIAIRPIRATTPLTKMVMTLGILGALQALALVVFGNGFELPKGSLPESSISILGTRVGVDRLILLGIAIAVTIGLEVWSTRSRLAIGTRAMSENEPAAVSFGLSPNVVGATNWALGSALSALAGILVVPILGLAPTTVPVIVVPALAAALVGKFDNYGLALGGGLLLGVAESLIHRYIHVSGLDAAAPFVLVMAALVLRRERGGNRLSSQPGLPVGTGRFRPIIATVVIAAVLGFVLLTSAKWLDATIVSLCFAILGLSLVVLIGYANQISLAQMALAGLGAFAAAKMAQSWGLPFIFAPLVGAAVGAVAGFVLGLPALRVRGIHLAVVTLATGIAAQRLIFENSKWSGGLNGITVPSPRVFGASVDAATHTRAYALVCLVWTVIAVGAVALVRRSSFGNRLLALRTNERAAASLSINVARSKLAAFMVSSALAGVAGVLLAFRNSPTVFTDFDFQQSISLVIIAVIAGVGTVVGGVLAGVMAVAGILYTGLDSIKWVQSHYDLIAGIGLVVTVLRHPTGIATPSKKRTTTMALPEASDGHREAQALVAEGIDVRFGGVRAVAGASLAVQPGEVVGLVGPNGAGKTTLLDAIGGFAPISGGRVILGRHDLSNASPNRRARLGMSRVFQSVELFDDMTIAENIRVGIDSAAHDGHLSAPAADVIERFGLSRTLDQRPQSLSAADRRLVGVARALASNPSVLLLDEPGAGLSITERDVFSAELRRLAKEWLLGILVVDHDMGLVMSACDRIVVLVQGSVIAEGTPSQIQANTSVRSAYLGDSEPPAGAGAYEGLSERLLNIGQEP